MIKREYIGVATIVGITAVVVSMISSNKEAQRQEVNTPLSTNSTASVLEENTNRDPARESRISSEPVVSETVYWDRKIRPFDAVIEKGNFTWTAEDGRDPEVIKVLANNSEMVKGLEIQNQWVLRRQLVYVSPEFTQQVEEIYNGEREKITLPGFDGAAFKIDIQHVTNEPNTELYGPISGGFEGKIDGQEDTQVFAASDSNYWSIGIKANGKSYQINNREVGEWIISEIDDVAMAAHFGECRSDRNIDDPGQTIVE